MTRRSRVIYRRYTVTSEIDNRIIPRHTLGGAKVQKSQSMDWKWNQKLPKKNEKMRKKSKNLISQINLDEGAACF